MLAVAQSEQHALGLKPMSKVACTLTSPWLLVGVPTTLAMIAWALMSEHSFQYRLVRQGKAHSLAGFAFVVLALVVMVAGAVLGANKRAKPRARFEPARHNAIITKVALAYGIIGASAQMLWLGLASIRAGGPVALIVNLRRLPTYYVRDLYFQTLPGITTLTQIAPVASVLAVIALRTMPRDGLTKLRLHARIAVVLGVLPGVFRALFVSERLALFDALVPLVILVMLLPHPHRKGHHLHTLTRVVAVIAVLGVVFVAAESTRSFRRRQELGVVSGSETGTQYGTQRLVDYAVMSVNNGIQIVANDDGHHTPTYLTLYFLWKFPVLNHLYPREVVAPSFDDGLTRLAGYFRTGEFNPEFTVHGGAGYLFIDYGWFGLVAAAATGYISGALYQHARRKRLLGLCVYPVWVLGLLEFYRIWSFGETRFFPTLVGAAVAAWVIGGLGRSKGPAARAEQSLTA